MRRISIQNSSNPLQKELHVRYCEGFFPRFLGLMFHPPLEPDDGIILVHPRENRADAGIHMLFMRTNLTVVWINSNLQVVDKRLARRWRPSYIPKQPASYVLECCTSRFSDFYLGDVLVFKELTERD